MCGRYGAMGGRRFPVLDVRLASRPTTRLAVSALLSFALHGTLYYVPIIGEGAAWRVAATENPPSKAGRVLELVLAPGPAPEKRAAPSSIAPKPVVPERRGISGSEARDTGLLAPPVPDKAPALLSGIDGEIDNSGVPGVMILRLQIGISGNVESKEVIYSDLPDAVGKELLGRFGAARYSPALRNGRAVEASVLFRVDVD